MKKIKNTKLLALFGAGALVLSAALGLGTGCGTTGNSTLLSLLEAGVTEATSLGTAEFLDHNPSYRPDFVLAGSVLTTVSTGTNTITSAYITSVLTQAGETNATVVTLITAGLADADAYLAKIGAANSNSVYLAVVGDLGAGFTEGANASNTLKSLKVKYHHP
jgi:hypothetical protein